MPTEKPRVTITMPEDQLEKVQMFQHDNMMKNQTQAILRLIELGFEELQRQEQNNSENKNAAQESDKANSRAAKQEQVRIIKALLESAGVEGDISENDLAFLQGIVLAVKAHFKESNKTIK